MVKKRIFGDTLKAQLQANARDRIELFLLANGSVRGAILEGTKLVNEMRANHELGVLETLILGHAYIGALLMSSNVKGQDRLVLEITCDGPAKGVSVEATAYGEVRGFLRTESIPLEKPLESFDMSPFFGNGVLSVTKILQEAKRPYSGEIELEYGNIAEDLANFHVRSEQIPSAFNISVKFDSDGEVSGAGGLIVQALPGSDPGVLAELEDVVAGFASIGEQFAERRPIDSLYLDAFADFDPESVGSRRVEFMCHCNRSRFARFVQHLPASDRLDIRQNGPFPLILRCHNCNTAYSFDREELVSITGPSGATKP